MKKLFSALLVSVLSLSLVACSGGSGKSSSATFVVGTTTDLKGEFFGGTTFDGSASDVDLQTMISGYSIATLNRDAEFLIDEKVVVKKWDGEVNADGSKTFTVTINDNLEYSDGTKITAKDYLFTVMLFASPEVFELGGTSSTGSRFVGYGEYSKGSKVFKGIRLIDDYTFSVTVEAENIPNFFELQFLAIGPTPVHIIAPNATLTDSEAGVKIDGMTVADLEKTISDPVSGFRKNPSVSSGPYKFVSYDASTKTGTVEINEKYKGNFEGEKAKIKTVVIKTVTQQTALQELENGVINFYSATSGEEIDNGLVLEEKGIVNTRSYYRNGFGALFFHGNEAAGATHYKSIRQAISYALDKTDFAKSFTGGYGKVVYADYAIPLWQTKAMTKELQSLNTYDFSLEKAKEVLVADGWVLNADGSAYGESGIRHKKLADGTIIPAQVEWMSSENNSVSALLSTMLPGNLEAIGIKLNKTEVPFSTLGTELQSPDSKYTMFNLAKSYSSVYDPTFSWSNNPKYWGTVNWSMSESQEVNDLAAKLAKRDYTDKDGYLADWLELQKLLNEEVYEIPLYSNQYFDLTSKGFVNNETDSFWGIRNAIVYFTAK